MTLDYGKYLLTDYCIANYYECIFLEEYNHNDSYDESIDRFNYFLNNISRLSYADIIETDKGPILKRFNITEHEKNCLIHALKDHERFEDTLNDTVDDKMYAEKFTEWERTQNIVRTSVMRQVKEIDEEYLDKKEKSLLTDDDVKDNYDIVGDFIKTWVGIEVKVLEYV